MTTWQDEEELTWEIKLTLDVIDRVREKTKIDLTPDGNDQASMTALLLQSRKLGEVLWLCCAPDIPRNEFFAGLDGEALTAGWHALVDAVVDFGAAVDEAVGAAIRSAIDAQLSAIEAGAQAMLATIKSDDTARAIERAVEKLAETMQAELVKALA